MLSTHVPGSYYTAEYIPELTGEEVGGFTDATAIVKPPIMLDRIARMLEGVTLGTVVIKEYATTASVTILDLACEIKKDGPSATEESAQQIMLQSLTAMIDRLNEIEDGQYPRRGNS